MNKNFHEMPASLLTLSNSLTILRIVLSPVIAVLLYYQRYAEAFALFSCAAATDFFDGYCARLLKQQTKIGALLDPLADKILIVTVVGSFALINKACFVIPFWFFALVALRESCMLVGAFYIIVMRKEISLSPSWMGKVTTALQLSFIGWSFACYYVDLSPTVNHLLILPCVAIMTVASFVQYVCRIFSAK